MVVLRGGPLARYSQLRWLDSPMNRLADEPSPYLRQHASNPVEWYSWGPEALERARREDRPILLSVGYSACHWCHVMAHESFENPAIAALMNAHFVCVKVDREERPDLDQLYQGVVQLMGRGGGWPLTVFLTPDLRPFYGGTYFPPAPRHGLPAFGTLVESIGAAWKSERAELERQADTFKAGLTDFAAAGLDAQPEALQASDLVAAARAMDRHVDRTNGGFGASGPKFPNPMNLAAMLRGFRRSGEASLRDDVLFTLHKMADGGVFDQLGGGFHRYSVDDRWLVPHFEKMLYDNAQLVHLYAEAFQLAPDPRFQAVVEQTIGWLQRELVATGGGFYATQDADSEHEEGRFFVWRPAELSALLPAADAALVTEHFNVRPGGNFEHGATILERWADEAKLARDFAVPEAEVRARLASAKAVLLEARGKRVAPGTDDKVLTGWNGLMIRGLCLAGRAFARPEWIALARRAGDFALLHLRRPDGTLLRSFQGTTARLEGVLEDYGDFTLGLVALYEATSDFSYLTAAEQLADLAFEHFWDQGKRAWLAARREEKDLLVPTYALHDNAFPSGASTLTDAQVRLTALTGHQRHLERATRYLERMKRELLDNPLGFGHLLLAADALVDGAAELTITGTAEGLAPFDAWLQRTWLPTVSVHRLVQGAPVAAVASEVLADRPVSGPAAAYVCRHFACQRPVSTPEALSALVGPG